MPDGLIGTSDAFAYSPINVEQPRTAMLPWLLG